MSDAPLAAVVYRGDVVESSHCAHVAVASAAGDVVARFGDVDRVTFTRSSMKAYQLLPLVASGAADRFGLTDAELAVMAASHSGEPYHVKAVAGILERIGLGVDALKCGAHPPIDARAAANLDGKPTPLHNNCSGKHAGMLAASVAQGWDTDTYLDPAHPVQVAIRGGLARAAGVPEESLGVGVDGCSAPNYAMPLAAGARLFATLARPERLGEPHASGLARIRNAMMRYPEMVGGTGRFDTTLMESAEGRLAAKGGAEGLLGVADVETGLGMFLKVEDGNSRAVGPVAVEALRQLGWLEERAFEVLGEFWMAPVTNVRERVVGRVKPVVELEMGMR